jgi:signal transduction histidine kinase
MVTVQATLWRSIAVFRFASLAYAAGLIAVGSGNYAQPGWAWVVLAGMTGWTAVTTVAYAVPARRTRALLAADLVVTAAALLSTALLQYPSSVAGSATPVTATWVAGPVLAWAVAAGSWAGAAAGIVLGLADLALHHQALTQAYKSPALNGSVLLLLAGVVVGYVSTLATRAERALQRATEIEAASRERERLARGIHDSVLQVLALVQRRGSQLGGEAAELGRLAGEQEQALRTLIAADAGPPARAGEADLRTLLTPVSSAAVSLAIPADPVLLPGRAARETAAAVRAALDNVRQHCGETARAWVLVEDEGDAVSVTVRDDGPGIPPGRLAEAEAEGRLGVSQAIHGRLRDLGGTASVTSSAGTGTEVLLRVPRSRPQQREPGPPAGSG